MSKHIAVLTSGGDAPGMNACIRAIVISARRNGDKVTGYLRGYNGLIDQQSVPLTCERMHNLTQRGGTILHSARCERFMHQDGIQQAADTLLQDGIDCLMVIGGDGSFCGAEKLEKCWDGQVIGIPGTIDNDITGTDATIGYYTAIETAVSSIDKVRDTADAFDRIFVVEVMGRESGFLGLSAALASSADFVIVPELFTTPEDCLMQINQQIRQRTDERGPVSYIIVLAENCWPGGISHLIEQLADKTGMEARPVTLGHVQRGGPPTSQDRILAMQLGTFACELTTQNTSGVMTAIVQQQLVAVPLQTCWSGKKPLNTACVATMQTLMNQRYQDAY